MLRSVWSWIGVLLSFITSTGYSASQEHIFAFRLLGEPETLDWNRAHTPIETYLLMNLMEGLLTFDDHLKLQGALAESWKASPDGKTYTFKLRKGVKWSDGVPLRAADFVYSWKRLLEPATAAPYAYLLFDVEGAQDYNSGKARDFGTVGIKALDEGTFQVKLAKAVSYWPYIPTFWVTFPMRQDLVEKYGSSWTAAGKMATVGPFVMTQHEIDSKVVMKPNPNYYAKRGNLDEVIGRVVTDDATALTLYEAGQLDLLTDLSTVELARLMKRPDFKSFPYLKTAYLGFVCNQGPFKNTQLRRAVAMAIDRSKITDLLHGEQRMATSFVPPGMMAYSKKLGLPYDVLKAKAELKRAIEQTIGISELELLIPNQDKSQTTAQFIQSELKKNLGLNVALQSFDNKTYRSQLKLKNHPFFILSWSGDYPDPDNFLSLFLSDAGNNNAGWKNAEFDALVLRARSMKKEKDREKAYLEAQRILLDQEAAVVPLYYEPQLALVKPRVKNLVINPLNYLLLKKVSLEP